MSKVGQPLPKVNIDENLRAFFGNESGNQCLPNERNASFDYCYNYFQGFRERGEICKIASDENLEMSCFQIGFYLASWGMLRGKSFLLQKSAHHYSELIHLVAETHEDFWSLGIKDYKNVESIVRILAYEDKIRKVVSEGGKRNRQATEILTTKIMLGIFGNVPAFDNYFSKGFGINALNTQSLTRIFEYYSQNKNAIDGQGICTVDFASGDRTERPYSTAKIIDMIFFIEGFK